MFPVLKRDLFFCDELNEKNFITFSFDNPNSWGLFIVFLNFTQSNPRVMSPDRKEISLNRASRWSRPFLIFHPPEKSASSILLSRFFLHIGCRYGVSPQISFFNGMKVSYNRNNHRSCDTLLKSFFWLKSCKRLV